MTLLLLLAPCLSARAQQQLFVCHDDSCDAYETRHVVQMVMTARDSLQIDQQPPYCVHDVDSIVFTAPRHLTVRRRGWWGDMANGSSQYLTYLDSPQPIDVAFSIAAKQGICLSAQCQLTFTSDEMLQLFLDKATDATNNPYLDVRVTQTGPRHFERWVMDNAILPAGVEIRLQGTSSCTVTADCTALLTGRPMSEVRTIVEAWVHQPPTWEDNPNYVTP